MGLGFRCRGPARPIGVRTVYKQLGTQTLALEVKERTAKRTLLRRLRSSLHGASSPPSVSRASREH
uniref:Uncharacterized protein n=1 Tax=Oryza nivara TaxID=4536 RepID=A0A0E0HD01_ORYNI